MYLNLSPDQHPEAVAAIKALGREKVEELMGLIQAWQQANEGVLPVIRDFFEEHGLEWEWWYYLWVEKHPNLIKGGMTIHRMQGAEACT